MTGEWEKKSNFDMVVRVPLLVSVPWLPGGSAGARTQELAELVDVYPTVAALAGLPPATGVDGTDLSPLFKEHAGGRAPPLKAAAYHQYPACDMDWAQGFNVTRAACNNAPRKSFSYMVRVCCAGILRMAIG